MTIGSLFSGIGGLELGLERAGLGPVKWQVEIDEYCRRVLAKHWPDAIRHNDVHAIGGHNLEPVEIICGGFPCQPFSQAGRQLGADDRRHLWPQFIRIIRQLRPRWVVAENVPGLLSIDAGRQFGGILGDLAESGYRVQWDCVPASAVGAPHRRDRVFIIADSDRVRCEQFTPARVHDNGQLGHDALGRSIAGEPWAGRLAPEPLIRRVANGVPRRVDRLRALGNAVVPQVAEMIGQMVVRAL